MNLHENRKKSQLSVFTNRDVPYEFCRCQQIGSRTNHQDEAFLIIKVDDYHNEPEKNIMLKNISSCIYLVSFFRVQILDSTNSNYTGNSWTRYPQPSKVPIYSKTKTLEQRMSGEHNRSSGTTNNNNNNTNQIDMEMGLKCRRVV